MKIIICGDIHGDWGALNQLIDKKKPDMILQVGDWGWFPHYHGKPGVTRGGASWNQYGVKNHQGDKITKIYWCGGNHENWDSLDKMGTEIYEIPEQKDVFFCPFGTTLELPDGQIVLFAGGAKSTDAHTRIEGDSWWRQEEISQADIDRLPDINVDIVISHTVPRQWMDACYYSLCGMRTDGSTRYHDSSTFALDIVKQKYNPKKWYSGHFHVGFYREIQGCKWNSLDMPRNLGFWWVELKD